MFDPERHRPWYYHAHEKQERPGEHRHFLTSLRGGGMPEGIAPSSSSVIAHFRSPLSRP